VGPPAGVWYIWGYMDYRSGGRAESGSGGEGARERERTTPSSKPLDKHSTPIDQQHKQETRIEVSTRKVQSIYARNWNDLAEECGNIRALWFEVPGQQNKTRPPSTRPIQICKDAVAKYYASESTSMISTLTPKC
jgi:hypothetical protein